MIKTHQHLCPCCSQPLLRHASSQRVYWFCQQCHQEMPDIENLVKPRFVPQHWASRSLERPALKTKSQESEKLYFGWEDHKNLQRLAFADSLTKIANRLRFQAYLDQEWQRMAQEQASLSLILGDIDYFQAYNAQYGHQKGDRCLLKVAQAIASVVTSADLVLAAGGEEFALILPRTKAEGAHRIAQDILNKVHNLKIPHLNSEIRPYITLSLGVASIIPSDQYSADLLINSADQALHQAKARGRDRLILHENLLQQINTIESLTISPIAIE
ncbi:MAG: diguanylate cyclase [Coleofasciculaceae cyanobacterium]